MTLLALTRNDVADYVSALCIVYIVLIFLNVLIGWVPRIPFYSRWLRGILDFITETTDPFINLFRRVLPSVGGGGFALDLSPMVAAIVVIVFRGVAVSLIAV